MLKSDLITLLIDKHGLPQKQAEHAVDVIVGAMTEALCRGENIEIRGLGSFHVKNYQGYHGRNPKTGSVIDVAPKRGVLFRASKNMREKLNELPVLPPEKTEEK